MPSRVAMQTHYVLLLCSFKEQLQQHVRVHAMEAVMACWEIEQSLQSLTGDPSEFHSCELNSIFYSYIEPYISFWFMKQECHLEKVWVQQCRMMKKIK